MLGFYAAIMLRRSCVAFLLLIATMPAQVRADELQNRLVAGARATDTSGYAFRQTITAAGTGAKGKTYVTAYDPRRALADRWRLVSVDGRAPTQKELGQSRKVKRGSTPAYTDLAKWLGSAATRIDGRDGTIMYRYSRLPIGTLKLGSHDASADTAAEVFVNAGGGAPYVNRVRFTSSKGFRMMLVASVRSMSLTSHFNRHSDGQMVPTDVTSMITGSMMGKSGELRTTVSYAEWQKAR